MLITRINQLSFNKEMAVMEVTTTIKTFTTCLVELSMTLMVITSMHKATMRLEVTTIHIMFITALPQKRLSSHSRQNLFSIQKRLSKIVIIKTKNLLLNRLQDQSSLKSLRSLVNNQQWKKFTEPNSLRLMCKINKADKRKNKLQPKAYTINRSL